jgi:hypothetical protein
VELTGLLLAGVMATSTADMSAECDTSAVVVEDLRAALETGEGAMVGEPDVSTAALSPAGSLSPAGGPIPDDAQSGLADLSNVDWANQFFLTQIYDPRWNPSGSVSDATSNNCGPASLAMLMSADGVLPAGLEAETAIDYARATMFPAYPAIDGSELPEGASVYLHEGLVLVDDDGHPVYLNLMESEPSLAQGIVHGGATPVFGYSWNELETLVQSHGAVIAHGHITEAWIGRFSGEYGLVGKGSLPHFIAVFPGPAEGDFVVSDPLHRGGAVVMGQQELQTFFKSPINEYDTAIRVVAWGESTNASD